MTCAAPSQIPARTIPMPRKNATIGLRRGERLRGERAAVAFAWRAFAVARPFAGPRRVDPDERLRVLADVRAAMIARLAGRPALPGEARPPRQTSTTTGTIMGRRRNFALTQRPTVRRTTCLS